MQLEELRIRYNHFGENKGCYTSEISVFNKTSKVTTLISPDVSDLILRTAIDHLVAATDEAAQKMKQDLLDSIKPTIPALSH